MLPAPELPPGPRQALVIATSAYHDESFNRLRAPAQDSAALESVLVDPNVGGFAVTSLADLPIQEIRVRVVEFLSGRSVDDLLVLYLSCHGIRDHRGRLYFAGIDTRKANLTATGLESGWLLEQLEDCRARRQVLILDCCFSGAFARTAKGETDLDLEATLAVPDGRGRAVLTASRAGEYSFEGRPLPGVVVSGSVFTAGLVDGLRTGRADHDRDGLISVEDAHEYAADYVRTHGAAQTPQRWLYGAEGKIWLARSPAGASVIPAPLPDVLRLALDSPYPELRLGALATIGTWLAGDVPEQEVTARQVLQQVADDDVARVATAARDLLAADKSSLRDGTVASVQILSRELAPRHGGTSGAGPVVEKETASLSYEGGSYRCRIRRRIYNGGEEPVSRWLTRITVDRFPGDPELSNTHHRTHPLALSDLDFIAICHSDGNAPEPMRWQVKQDRDALKEIWLLFENDVGSYPLYPGQRTTIEYGYSVHDYLWGPWFERAIRLPTRLLAIRLDLPAELDPQVWGVEKSLSAGEAPLRTPVVRQADSDRAIFEWETAAPSLHARYRLQWRFRQARSPAGS